MTVSTMNDSPFPPLPPLPASRNMQPMRTRYNPPTHASTHNQINIFHFPTYYMQHNRLSNTTTNTQRYSQPNTYHQQQSPPPMSSTAINNGGGVEEDYKLRYQYNLLVSMQSNMEHMIISRDTTISAILITIWCMFNMFGFGLSSNITNKEDPEYLLYNLLLFLITILIIHKDLILCNGQSCLPLLLLFNFTIRMIIECLIEWIIHIVFNQQFAMTFYGVNIGYILCVLLFSSQRFIFNLFGRKDMFLKLMKCRLFYRGEYIRWTSFLMYCWFCSLMMVQLIDTVCMKHLELFGNAKNFGIIACDIMVFGYGTFVLWIWSQLKQNTLECNYYLQVEGYTILEILLFIFVFILTFGLYESWLTELLVKKMTFTVIIVLVINFLMRDS